MFGDMMGKLQEMKQKVEETKKRLDTVYVHGEAADGGIRVTANGNRKITDIQINEALLKDKEELQDLLIVAMNRAIENADKVNEAEMQSAAKGIMPNIPGLGL